ncbi:MAG: DUF692 domain-containing protein [Rhodospirillales bacterium]|nr:DUF692 domain-containing protein [Rhodospirillales bacterium]
MTLQGFGLGLRPQHFPEILGDDPNAADGVDWFEIISENFIGVGGPPLHNMMAVRERFPMVMHGVSLSIGSTDPLDGNYLKGLKELADLVEPELISDHLCWTGVHGLNMHDLLPLPLTEESAEHVATRVMRVQDVLGRRFMLENTSTYVTFEEDEMTEWEFLSEICRRADCDILLDVNNIYVSGFNHGFSMEAYLDGVPTDRVKQIHLAGHEHNGDYIVDTHDEPVPDYVLDLYAKAVKRFGHVPTMIERDANIPPFAELVRELKGVRLIAERELDMVPA